MPRLLMLLTGLLLLSHFPCNASVHTRAEAPVYLAAAGQQTTELQQQSDHHRRVSREEKEREIEKEMAAVGAVRTESRGLDNFVMIMLVVSAGALFFVSSRFRGGKKRGRRARRLPAR